METKRAKTRLGTQAARISSLVLSVIVDYIACFFVQLQFQVKVEYMKDKRKIFMVSSRLVSAAEYRFKDLVEDITSRCTKLNYLNETTIRLRY